MVVDGVDESYEDVVFSSSKSTVGVQWEGFADPESGIREYAVKISKKM